MRTHMFIVILVLSLVTPNSAFGKALLFLGDDNFPPFSFTDDNGSFRGIDVDMLTEISNRLQLDIKIDLVPWKRLLQYTKAGKCDGSFALFKTPNREEYAIFIEPFHYSNFTIFSKKGGDFKYEGFEDLYGKTFGNDAGFDLGARFKQAIINDKIILRESYSRLNNVQKVVAGRLDGFIGNSLLVRYDFTRDKTLAAYRDQFIEHKKPVIEKRGAYLVLSKASGIENKQLLAKNLRQVIVDIFEDGTYDKIVRKYASSL